MSNSFVKRAPEIAEEILLKAASGYLPDVLRPYAKALLSKEASDDREKLVAPERMALSELQKIAHSNKVSLPVITSVNSDDWSSIAGDLVKVASRHEAENGREIFENAAAMVALKKEAGVVRGAGGGAVAARVAGHARPLGFWGKMFAGKARRYEGEIADAAQHAQLSTMPGTRQHAAAQDLASQAASRAADSSAAADAVRRGQDIKEKAVSHAPLMAAAIGIPAAAIAMRREPAKREDVRIYK
jgi:hypothetical protein